ncbi:MAG: hypothetical protein IPH96_10555 [Saprospiraceae bacterium]|nr:hypothetical protein [Saprospiraceae bacterium]
MFVAKYNSSGDVQWVNQINVIGITYEVDNTHFSKVEIVADKQGNCYTSFSYDTLLICEKFADKPLVGDNDLFIVKYNTSGEAGWLYTNGSQNNSIYSGSMHVDGTGDLLVSGSFTGEIKILSTLKANGAYDIFVAKFAPDATIKWAKSISGSKSEYCNYITTDAKNEIYLTGGFEGSIVNNKAKITSTGEFDAFLTKLDLNGELISLYNIAEGPGKQSGTCIAVKDSIIAVAGNTLSQMSILSVPFPYYKDYDAFVVSLMEHNIVVTPPPPPPPPPPPYINPSIKLSAAFINAGQAIQINGQFFNPNGNVQISLEGPVSISVGNAFPASTSGAISFNLGTTSLRSGTYKCIAADLVSGKIATASFRVKTLPVSDNFLTILRPNNPIGGVINEAIQIEWSDYMFVDSKYKLIGPYREYSYKLEGQRNNGNWTTIKNITGNGLKNTNITIATQYVPVATGEFRFRITDNLSTLRNKTTQIVTVANNTTSGATMEFLWDKSYKTYPATAPVGCAADGTSRMYIKLTRNASDADFSERIVTVKANITLQNNTTLNLSKNIIIVRPPLMLVHGLNGDHSTWDNLLTKYPTVPFIRDTRFKIVKAVDMELYVSISSQFWIIIIRRRKGSRKFFQKLNPIDAQAGICM